MNKEIWEPLFIIERLKEANINVFVYIILAVLSERFSELSKFVALPNFFSEKASSKNILRHYLY